MECKTQDEGQVANIAQGKASVIFVMRLSPSAIQTSQNTMYCGSEPEPV